MSPESLAAKGDGGMRIPHKYMAFDQVDQIETPPDDFEPNKVDAESYDAYINERNKEVPDQVHRI
jgi:hypothetical protein